MASALGRRAGVLVGVEGRRGRLAERILRWAGRDVSQAGAEREFLFLFLFVLVGCVLVFARYCSQVRIRPSSRHGRTVPRGHRTLFVNTSLAMATWATHPDTLDVAEWVVGDAEVVTELGDRGDFDACVGSGVGLP